MTLRYAAWAAVSTLEQARPEKLSIPYQLERAATAAREAGWVETAGPFIVEGQSRTKYIQLDQAVAEIEPLRLMLQSARQHEYDVLVMTEFDRLRELLDQVFRTLAQYRVQLYAVAQPIEPKAPSLYNIHEADSVAMLIGLSQITSRQEISRLRRKWNVGMPKRITELGLPAAHLPFGYRKPKGRELDRKAVPEPIPELAAHLVKLKDLLLAGRSTTQLIDYLVQRRVQPPKSAVWHPQTVRDILRNPFYAGIVRFGATRVYLDPQTETRKRNRRVPPDQIQRGKGKHKPLWDEDTHRAILLEFKRRVRGYRGRVNNQFTGLMKCGVCGKSMWRQHNGPRSDRLIWRCSSTKSANGHCNITHSLLLEKVSAELAAQLKPYVKSQQAIKRSPADQRLQQDAVTVLERKLTRLEDAYLAGEWDLNRYAERKSEIQNEIAQHRNSLLAEERAQAERRAWARSLAEFEQLKNLPAWMKQNDPAEVNRSLHLLLDSIVVSGEKIELRFR